MDTSAEGEVYFELPSQNLITQRTDDDVVTVAEATLKNNSNRPSDPTLSELSLENAEGAPRYTIFKQLSGKGGSTNVYRGHDNNPVMDRKVAVKILNHFPNPGLIEEYSEEMELEAKAQARMDHPNIVKIYDLVRSEVPGRKGLQSILIMEWMDPEKFPTLFDLIDRGIGSNPELIIRVVKSVGDAADYMAKNHNFYHRDIKPSNIFVGEEKIKLGDMGSGKWGTENQGKIRGTIQYMSPESFFLKHVDVRSEVFSIADVVYMMISGSTPYAGSDYPEIQENIINQDYPKLADKNDLVAKWGKEMLMALDGVLSKAQEKNPDNRYQTATEFSNAIEEALKPFVN